MGHAGLDTADEYLANTAIALTAAALNDSHIFVGLARAPFLAPDSSFAPV